MLILNFVPFCFIITLIFGCIKQVILKKSSLFVKKEQQNNNLLHYIVYDVTLSAKCAIHNIVIVTAIIHDVLMIFLDETLLTFNHYFLEISFVKLIQTTLF